MHDVTQHNIQQHITPVMHCSTLQAFSTFFASWAKTKARLLEGGVKVFTFWIVCAGACSPVTSSKI